MVEEEVCHVEEDEAHQEDEACQEEAEETADVEMVDEEERGNPGGRYRGHPSVGLQWRYRLP